jgi:hypothetical protein
MSGLLRRGWVCCIVVSTLLTGCGGSSLDSRQPDLANRESLNADELDALTAAGESSEQVEFKPPGLDGGFQQHGSTFQDVPGSRPQSQGQMPVRQPIAVPSLGQFNSIRQVR